MATKTINLTGAEVVVTGLDGAHAHIRNDGTEVIYAAKTAGITAGADGVASIPAGQSDTIRGISGTVYLLGTGSVLIQSDDYVASPFKTSAASGGSAVDEVARAAIHTHSGNDEIHVTAEEKASWNGKAELTDIPTSLPANGGNAEKAEKITWGNTAYGMDILAYAESAPQGQRSFVRIYGSPSCPINYGYDPSNNDFWYVIDKLDDNWISITAKDIRTNREFVNTRSIDGWAGWLKCSDGGNATTLDTHPASDFVLKTDYDALAARVAALEGGTT